MAIDPAAIAWYAAICGALSAFAPTVGGRGLRIAVGAVVGVLAATLLPALRSALGI